MTPAKRQARKAMVFHIMYGTFSGASVEEMAEWRYRCAHFINGLTDSYPTTLEELRGLL
jgi:hypothetical protein